MARDIRFHAPGLLYHVVARGNNQESVFIEEANRERFLKNLKRFKEKFKFKLFAYALMDNHFHLLVEVGDISISKIMQVLLTAYTMYFNKKYNRIGHLFQGRFKSIIVDKDEYLLEVIRYIHLNPVRAGLANKPEDYRWSSYDDYLKTNSDLISMEEVLLLFSQKEGSQFKNFREFILAGINKEWDIFQEQARGILGDEMFWRRITRLSGVRP